MAVKIQKRRGTAAQWTLSNPILLIGEPGYETDTGKEKTGDGVTAWASLPYTSGGGIVAYASQAEVDAGSVADKSVSPATFQQGITNRYATIPEAQAGTNTAHLMNPALVASAIKSQTVQQDFTYWPSAPAETTIIFKSWENMCIAISQLPFAVFPKITFVESCTIPAVGMPLNGWDMRGGSWNSISIATGSVAVTVPDGVKFRDLYSLQNGIYVVFNPTTADGVLFFTTNILPANAVWVFVVGLGAGFVNTGTKSLIVSPGGVSQQYVVFAFSQATMQLGTPNVGPWVVMAGTDVLIFHQDGVFGGLSDGIAIGNCGALIYQDYIDSTTPNLPGLTSGTTMHFNGTRAKNLNYDDTLVPSPSIGSNVQVALDYFKTHSGGGGSAYPDQVSVHVTNDSLTNANQGMNLNGTGGGITLTLPATAATGETYKFLALFAPITISIAAGTPLNWATSPSLTIGPGTMFTTTAVNLGPALYWMVAQNQDLSWNATAVYPQGKFAIESGNLYLSMITNTGATPSSNPATWLRIQQPPFIPQVIQMSHREATGIAGGTATADGAYHIRPLDNMDFDVKGNIISFNNDGLGAGISEFMIKAGDYILDCEFVAHQCGVAGLMLFESVSGLPVNNNDAYGLTLDTNTNTAATGTILKHRQKFTSTGVEKYSIQMRNSSTRATDGFGVAAAWSGVPEKYGFVRLTRIA